MSEVPPSKPCDIHREPRAIAAIPCPGLSGRVQTAPGSSSRPVAIIVPPDATVEAGGGAPEPSELTWAPGAAQGATSPAAAGTGSVLPTSP